MCAKRKDDQEQVSEVPRLGSEQQAITGTIGTDLKPDTLMSICSLYVPIQPCGQFVGWVENAKPIIVLAHLRPDRWGFAALNPSYFRFSPAEILFIKRAD